MRRRGFGRRVIFVALKDLVRTSLILTLLPSLGGAQDLGQVGAVFEITEPCLLTTIQKRLQAFQQTGKLDVLQKEFEGRVRRSLERPRPVAGLAKAWEKKTRSFDPSLTLRSDLKDRGGRVFARAGQRINPLQYVSFGADVLFFDGDDPEQVAWAQREPASSGWVLVKGAPFELQNQVGRPVYFDQGGILAKKFDLQAVPTRVRQEGLVLRIEEVPPQETPLPFPSGKKRRLMPR